MKRLILSLTILGSAAAFAQTATTETKHEQKMTDNSATMKREQKTTTHDGDMNATDTKSMQKDVKHHKNGHTVAKTDMMNKHHDSDMNAKDSKMEKKETKETDADGNVVKDEVKVDKK